MAMKIPEQVDFALSDDEIAVGMWLAFENAGRLIDDAKSLMASGGYTTAQGGLRVAVEEIAKVLLLNQAIYWDKDDQEKWDYFWQAWDNHKEKLRLVEYLYHWNTNEEQQRFHQNITVLLKSREWLWYVDFDPISRAYRAPQIRHISQQEAHEFTEVEMRYAEMLLGSLTPVQAGSMERLKELVPEIRALHANLRDWPPPQESEVEDANLPTHGEGANATEVK